MADDSSMAIVTTVEKIKKCQLLELPLELRTMIYSHALIYHDTIRLWTVIGEPDHPRCEYYDQYRLGLSPNLLATCAQIKREATPILYGSNRISFSAGGHAGPSLPVFIATTHASVQYLRDIELDDKRFKKAIKANLVLLRKVGVKLSKLSIRINIWGALGPHQMADLLRPLIRALDKQWKADTTRNTTDILDRLRFVPYWVHEREFAREDAEQYTIIVRDSLRTMLKK